MVRSRSFFQAFPLLLLPLFGGCGGDGEGAPAPADPRGEQPAEVAVPSFSYAGAVLDEATLPPLPPDPGEGGVAAHETERDWAIAARTVAWARSQALSELPVGELAAILGSTFVGAPYEPGTLEFPGEERLVMNLRTFDCVTFVEHVLVLSHLVRDAGVEPDAEAGGGEAFRSRYRALLTGLRYRGGIVDGYVSRLHYFTEWMDHAAEAGLLDDVTETLGGIPDPRPIHFMTSNTQAYRQLAEDPALVPRIRAIEEALSARVRHYIPEGRIAEVEGGIRSGDVIAAVSTLDGLDIAHTGIAIRHEGRIHLLHAPLVGDSVEISPLPLADRIQGIRGQQGIRVARPR
jgi:hypothetical protein